ncbi:hypothetical protein TOPH_00479, partial [Tolypocladium ophioglossoides CBS 100239]
DDDDDDDPYTRPNSSSSQHSSPPRPQPRRGDANSSSAAPPPPPLPRAQTSNPPSRPLTAHHGRLLVLHLRPAHRMHLHKVLAAPRAARLVVGRRHCGQQPARLRRRQARLRHRLLAAQHGPQARRRRRRLHQLPHRPVQAALLRDARQPALRAAHRHRLGEHAQRAAPDIHQSLGRVWCVLGCAQPWRSYVEEADP